MKRSELAPNDRVYRWWDAGCMGADLQPLTVVRVNRVTATVRTDQGNEFRMAFEGIEGKLLPDEDPVGAARATDRQGARNDL